MTSILAFFTLICVLVFVHEYGHFWAARSCGVRVRRFSIGFGKVLWKKTDQYGTEFAFSLIPLGGYVQMYNGENAEYLESQALQSKSLLQRAFIVIAGPLANFLFAILAYWVVFYIGIPSVKPVIDDVIPNTIAAQAKLPREFEIQKIAGQAVVNWEEVTFALMGKIGTQSVSVEGKRVGEDINRAFTLDLSNWQVNGYKENPLTSLGIRAKNVSIEPIIDVVVEDSAAAKAGVQVGDEILRINGRNFDWLLLLEQVKTGQLISLEIKRDNVVHQLMLEPEKSSKENRYLIGIQPQYQPLSDKYRTELRYDILTAFEKAIHKVVSLVRTILQFVGNLLTGELSISNMGGPISMAKGAGITVEAGWVYYLGFMALISLNLAVMNLFPILPLDGGQLILLIAQAIKGKPLSEKVQMVFQKLGVIFVLGLMVFTLFNDLVHF